ncbi:hypothetical protein D1632_11935 [Chryseobacterium nematophagum]|uniref:PQ-loop repeat-containing protein n=1 Tax=Chryseobacterium nematophagum TaxID=2305228 RepID=A0A3M7L9W8_9FLAO|nr:hypothetical protein D1632_11935 [Chryseobacterium nematophagum]
MNFRDIFVIVFLITLLNCTVYIIFKKYFYGKPDAGMKFLAVNILKDIIWLIISLSIIDKTKDGFLSLVICFIVASFLIYLPVIKLINKS